MTDKIRQFDIRAVKHEGNSTLALAVECKNLRPNSPLLLSAVPRTTSESFHDLIVWERQLYPFPQSVRPISGVESAYRPGEMVAKKTDQVGRDSDGLVSDDEATFGKLNQAVNSCRDLVQEYLFESSAPLVRALVPLLVVPPELLWQVDYSAEGTCLTGPRQVRHTTLFLNSAWSNKDLGHGVTRCYRLSHIELVTLDALPNVVATYFGARGFFVAVKQ